MQRCKPTFHPSLPSVHSSLPPLRVFLLLDAADGEAAPPMLQPHFRRHPGPRPDRDRERESGRDLQCRYRKERRVRKSSFPSWIDQTRKRSRFETLSFWAQTKICELHNSPYPREFWPIIRGVVYSSHLHPPAREVNWKVNGNSTLPLPPSSCAI